MRTFVSCRVTIGVVTVSLGDTPANIQVRAAK